MSISPDGKRYLEELQADAARWRYVLKLLSRLFSVDESHVEETIDRLIEEAKGEGK